MSGPQASGGPTRIAEPHRIAPLRRVVIRRWLLRLAPPVAVPAPGEPQLTEGPADSFWNESPRAGTLIANNIRPVMRTNTHARRACTRDGPPPQRTAQNLSQPMRPAPLYDVVGHRLRRIRLGTATGHAANTDAEHDPRALLTRGEWNRGGLPPHRMTLKEALGQASQTRVLCRVGKFFIVPQHDDAGPLPVGVEFLTLETDQRILAHPFDFLAQRGVPIEVVALEVDTNGHDSRLIVPGAGESSDIAPGQHRAALRLGHLVDVHGTASRVNRLRLSASRSMDGLDEMRAGFDLG